MNSLPRNKSRSEVIVGENGAARKGAHAAFYDQSKENGDEMTSSP
jgi:hypothetical protein